MIQSFPGIPKIQEIRKRQKNENIYYLGGKIVKKRNVKRKRLTHKCVYLVYCIFKVLSFLKHLSFTFPLRY
jgi:hypothetical protein